MISTLALATLLSPLATTAQETPSPADVEPTTNKKVWGKDIPSAIAQAKETNKAVLVVFTGSDWCPPCKMLKQNVFDNAAFAPYAEENFILVEIDIPNGDYISEVQKTANRELAKQYKIQGFPTNLILTQDGIVLGGFIGYKDWQESVDIWNQALSNKVAIDADYLDSNQLTGIEKARALNAIAQQCPAAMRSHNISLHQQIIGADVDDQLGLRATAQREAAEKAAQQTVSQLMRNTEPAQLITTIDAKLGEKNLDPALEMGLRWARFDARLMNIQTETEIDELKAEIIAFGQANPSEQDRANRLIQSLFATPSADLLKRIQSMRQK